ncbi:hypothetical protein [Micromonospora chersina]
MTLGDRIAVLEGGRVQQVGRRTTSTTGRLTRSSPGLALPREEATAAVPA